MAHTEHTAWAGADDVRHDALSTRIAPLKLRKDPQRAALIWDLVDAFARLRASALRFVLMLERSADDEAGLDPTNPPRFDLLLALLREYARRAALRRQTELHRLLERALDAERRRDQIFSAAATASIDTLRDATAELERLDTELVGLCVEHVLDAHAQPGTKGQTRRPSRTS